MSASAKKKKKIRLIRNEKYRLGDMLGSNHGSSASASKKACASFFGLTPGKPEEVGGFVVNEENGFVIGHILESSVDELASTVQTMTFDNDARMIICDGDRRWLVTDLVADVQRTELEDYLDDKDDTVDDMRLLGRDVIRLLGPFILLMVVEFNAGCVDGAKPDAEEQQDALALSGLRSAQEAKETMAETQAYQLVH